MPNQLRKSHTPQSLAILRQKFETLKNQTPATERTFQEQQALAEFERSLANAEAFFEAYAGFKEPEKATGIRKKLRHWLARLGLVSAESEGAGERILPPEEQAFIAQLEGDVFGIQPDEAEFFLPAKPSPPKSEVSPWIARLSAPDYRALVNELSRNVLEKLNPKELAVFDLYINPLLDKTARGEFVAFGGADSPARFGGQDLVIVIIVPIVAAMVDDLLNRLGHATVSGIRRKLTKEEIARIEFKVGEVEAFIKITQPTQRQVNIEELTKAINQAVLESLAR